MEHVRWSSRPALRRPVLITAFEGWNDAGDAASTAARWLRDRWASRPFAEIDPEEFFDFTATRPQVRIEDGKRQIDWPITELSAGTIGGRDVVILLGNEPQLRWRTYSEQVVHVARELDVELVVTLGALLAEVPHTRPTSIVCSTEDDALAGRLDASPSNYEGPTGIVGVLHDAFRRSGVPTASLWAAVSAYVPGAPSPKAALALVERVATLLDTSVTATDLEIAAAAYERQVSEVVADDEEMTDYLDRLEMQYDEDDGVPSPSALVEEVERFLREQRER
jgi:proteasome assembly chaperone (PAC2) family protein